MSKIAISRRSALTAAGPTLAVAACGKQPKARAEEANVQAMTASEVTSGLKEFLQQLGVKPHGKPPKEPYPFAGQAGYPTYEPGHFMLIYVASTKPWQIFANHAVFAYKSKVPKERMKQVIDLLELKKPNPLKPFSQLSSDVADGLWPGQTTPAKRDHLFFKNLGFGSQHDIFIYFDHKLDATDPDKDEILFDQTLANFITFSEHKFSGSGAAENHAFYNLRKVSKSAMAPIKEGTLFSMENWFTAQDGKTIPAGFDASYKTNFLYFTNGIPMLIDPDTGNGTSWQP
jgi:hypothetical protein